MERGSRTDVCGLCELIDLTEHGYKYAILPMGVLLDLRMNVWITNQAEPQGGKSWGMISCVAQDKQRDLDCNDQCLPLATPNG